MSKDTLCGLAKDISGNSQEVQALAKVLEQKAQQLIAILNILMTYDNTTFEEIGVNREKLRQSLRHFENLSGQLKEVDDRGMKNIVVDSAQNVSQDSITYGIWGVVAIAAAVAAISMLRR
jgi:hypothetical protein